MPLIDISPPVHEGTAVWPGDRSFRREVSLAIVQGHNIDLSSIHTTVHVGAHADAPSHYVAGGQGIHERALERYYGRCQVVAAQVGRGERVLPSHLQVDIRAERVLVRTETMPDPDHFNEDFASLSPELIRYLASRGVVLVGIDTPSVDPFADAVLHSHRAIAEADMAILEGLVLDHVAPGFYTLIALPLRLVGADASPVRAALIPE